MRRGEWRVTMEGLGSGGVAVVEAGDELGEGEGDLDGGRRGVERVRMG